MFIVNIKENVLKISNINFKIKLNITVNGKECPISGLCFIYVSLKAQANLFKLKNQ